MSQLRLACLAGLVLAAPAAAQDCKYIPDNNATTGTCNVIPFGTTKSSSTWRNQRYQTILTNAQLGGPIVKLICEIGFAPCRSGPNVIHFDALTITMAQTKQKGFGAGNNNFATNLSNGKNQAVVLNAKNYTWHATSSQWSRIGLQKNYRYVKAFGDNLLIDIVCRNVGRISGSGTGMHRSSTIERLYAFGWSTNPPATGQSGISRAALKIEVCFDVADLTKYGQSCAGSSGTPVLNLSGSAKLGSTANFDLTGGPATRPTLLILGLTTLQTPLDLTGIGAPGCYLYQPIDFAFVGVTNGSGALSFGLPIPKSKGLLCARLYGQYAPMDTKANKSGFSFTNQGRVLIGN